MDNIIEYFDDKQEDIARFFRTIKYGIENLISWIPIIWQDRDWDQWFLYKVLQHKLKQMVRLQRKYGNSVNAHIYADQMQLCVNLLERLINDEYLENALKPHEKKWGESKMIWEPLPDNDNLCQLKRFHVDKAITPEQIKQEDKERMRIYKHSDMLREQDLDMLFKLMRKNIEGWWD